MPASRGGVWQARSRGGVWQARSRGGVWQARSRGWQTRARDGILGARRCTNGRQDPEATTEAEKAEGADNPEGVVGRSSAGPRQGRSTAATGPQRRSDPVTALRAADRAPDQAAPVPVLPGA
jgi:hypothetical protein